MYSAGYRLCVQVLVRGKKAARLVMHGGVHVRLSNLDHSPAEKQKAGLINELANLQQSNWQKWTFGRSIAVIIAICQLFHDRVRFFALGCVSANSILRPLCNLSTPWLNVLYP